MDNSTAVIGWEKLVCCNVTEVTNGPAYQKKEEFKIVGIMRRGAKKSATYAKRYGAPKFIIMLTTSAVNKR